MTTTMTMTKQGVLVWPGLTELGYEIIASLKPLRFYEIYTASSKAVSLETQLAEHHFHLPDVSDPTAIEELSALVRSHNISIIYPAHDDVIVFCRHHADQLPGVTIIAPPSDVTTKIRSKHLTYQALKEVVSVPEVYYDIDAIPGYPVFAKPDCGQGSQGVRKIDTHAEMEVILTRNPNFFQDFVVAELLPGDEFTIDCLSGPDGQLAFAAARRRIQIRNGISTDAELVDLPGVLDWAKAISAQFNLIGAWFFQLKYAKDGTLKLLEVAPRLGGASCLNRIRGVNFAHLSILAAQGKKFEVMERKEPSRIQRRLANYPIQILTSLNAIYVDFDDCLLLDDHLNTDLLMLLYKHQGRGARIVLVSRHDGDLLAWLHKLRIKEVFDAIYHIKDPNVLKSEIVAKDMAQLTKEYQQAIFIDDSFKERKDVADTLGIEVFDLTMLDVLQV